MASGDPEIMHPRCRCDQHRLHWPHGQSTQAPIGEPSSGRSYVTLQEIADKVAELAIEALEPDDDPTAHVVEISGSGDKWHVTHRQGKSLTTTVCESYAEACATAARWSGEKLPAAANLSINVDTSEAMRKMGKLAKSISYLEGVAAGRANTLASLPPCQITDPAALAKLTPSKVRAYLKGKGWVFEERAILCEYWTIDWTFRRGRRVSFALPRAFAGEIPAGLADGVAINSELLRELAEQEQRSQAAVYLDILATPEEGA